MALGGRSPPASWWRNRAVPPIAGGFPRRGQGYTVQRAERFFEGRALTGEKRKEMAQGREITKPGVHPFEVSLARS